MFQQISPPLNRGSSILHCQRSADNRGRVADQLGDRDSHEANHICDSCCRHGSNAPPVVPCRNRAQADFQLAADRPSRIPVGQTLSNDAPQNRLRLRWIRISNTMRWLYLKSNSQKERCWAAARCQGPYRPATQATAETANSPSAGGTSGCQQLLDRRRLAIGENQHDPGDPHGRQNQPGSRDDTAPSHCIPPTASPAPPAAKRPR